MKQQKVKLSRKLFAEALYLYWLSRLLREKGVKKFAKDLGFEIRNEEDFIKICWELFILDMWLIVYTCECEGLEKHKGEECLDIFDHLVYHHFGKEEKGFNDWMRAVALGGLQYSMDMNVIGERPPLALSAAALVFEKRLFGQVQEEVDTRRQLIIYMRRFMEGLEKLLKQYDIE